MPLVQDEEPRFVRAFEWAGHYKQCLRSSVQCAVAMSLALNRKSDANKALAIALHNCPLNAGSLLPLLARGLERGEVIPAYSLFLSPP